jgi:hypothetical protein
MTQPFLDWTRDINLPVSGKTSRQRHASSTGAQRAVTTRGPLAKAYLDLLTIAGERGMSDFEAAAALGRLVSSMCSTRNGLRDLIVESGSYETTPFNTKRTRYTLAKQETKC